MSEGAKIELALDAGGTFTDAVLRSDVGITVAKVPTTQYDLSRCFFDGLGAVAAAAGFDLDSIVKRAERIVYSTTLGTNTLVQRSGPRVGLITTAGTEDVLEVMRGLSRRDMREVASDALAWGAEKPAPLVSRENVVGVRERVDRDGRIVVPLDDRDLRLAAQRLLDAGVNAIAVSLRNAVANPVHERQIRDLLRREYPAHLLGSVPIFISSDVAPYRGEYGRANTTIVDAYLHRPLARFLFPLEEDLRRRGYRGEPLLILGNDGSAARVAKTTAIRTWNSGPVAGVLGGVSMSAQHELGDAVLTDMGGTSFDIAVLAGGRAPADVEPVIEGGLRLRLPVVSSRTIGSGGGTIARRDPGTGRILVGPESAEAVPGPAAFGLGGERPTVTDADVALGLIDPDRFLGGRFPLVVDLAREALTEHLSVGDEVEVEALAQEVRGSIQHQMANRLRRELATHRLAPADTTVVAYGGAGPTHICGVAREVGCRQILVPPLASTFSAVGASGRGVQHQHEKELVATGEEVELEAHIASLSGLVMRDMRVEGYAEGDVATIAEVELSSAEFEFSDWCRLEDGASLDAALANARDGFLSRAADFAAVGSARPADGSCAMTGVRVRTDADAGSPSALPPRDIEMPEFPSTREVWLGGRWQDVPVRRVVDLRAGEQFSGPAIVELFDSTCVVEEGFNCEADESRNCWIRRDA